MRALAILLPLLSFPVGGIPPEPVPVRSAHLAVQLAVEEETGRPVPLSELLAWLDEAEAALPEASLPSDPAGGLDRIGRLLLRERRLRLLSDPAGMGGGRFFPGPAARSEAIAPEGFAGAVLEIAARKGILAAPALLPDRPILILPESDPLVWMDLADGSVHRGTRDWPRTPTILQDPAGLGRAGFAVPLSPDDWERHLRLRLLEHRFRTGAAPRDLLDAARAAVEGPDTSPWAHARVARLEIAAGEAGRARDRILRILPRASRWHRLHRLLGDAARGIGRPSEGIDHYTAALETDPDDIEARYGRAIAQAARGAYGEAIVDLRGVGERVPTFHSAQAFRIRLLARVQDRSEALGGMEAGRRGDEDSTDGEGENGGSPQPPPPPPLPEDPQLRRVILLLRDLVGGTDEARDAAWERFGEHGIAWAPQLKQALRFGEGGVRRMAIRVLADYAPADPRLPMLLVDRLQSDADESVRIEAAKALGRIGERSVVPRLAELLEEEETTEETRRWIAYTLVELGHPPAVAWLQGDLAHAREDYRWRAARVLGRERAIEAVPVLIERLADEAPLVRLHAARALGEIRDRRAVPALLERLREEEARDARTVVGEALERLTGERFGTDLERWEAWWARNRHDFESVPPNEEPEE